MDAREYFLHLHDHAHGRGSRSAHRVFHESTEEQLRTILPGHNSMAWIIWHIARGEDWGVNAMFRGTEQILTRDGWLERLRVPRLDFGNGMNKDEVADLTRNIDVEALRGYFDAVTSESHRFFETLDFDRLDDLVDVPARLKAAPGSFTSAGDVVSAVVEQMKTGRWFVDAMAICDVMMHVNEAQHVFRELAPELRWG